MFNPGQQLCQSSHTGSSRGAVTRSQSAHAECAPVSATVAPPLRGPHEWVLGSDFLRSLSRVPFLSKCLQDRG